MPAFSVATRFCGPPNSANGGYFAGRLASFATATVRVRLCAPIPLNTELQVLERDAGRLDLLNAGEVIAYAEPDELQLDIPSAPDYVDAIAASRRFIAFERHAFPGCFVCGTARTRGDGLRIFAGANVGKTLVAAPWVPDESLASADGKVAAEFMCAALDCPGYFAARDDGVPMLLGEYTAHVDRRVHVDEPCVVIGWRIAVKGRKYEVGTALFDEDGELCGRARAVWLELKPQA
jgi:hypothetical protein